MACATCTELGKKTDLQLPHVLRLCADCGDEFPYREDTNFGLAINVRKGDKFIIPREFLKISANPLKSTGQLTRSGVEWFAELVFKTDVGTKSSREGFSDTLKEIQEQNEAFFVDADWLQGLDFESESDAPEISKRLDAHEKSIEWWGFVASVYCSIVEDAIRDGDASLAAWAMACAERFRTLALFKENFAEVVFMGHSAKRIVNLLQIWDANKDRDEEGYWQKILTDNAFALSQMFAAPVTFIEGSAYVGGTQIDGKDARYLDFMLSGGSANSALLVEIKTPMTRLLGSRYRKNVFVPSKDLSGAIVQISDYTEILRKNVESITRQTDIELNTFNPRRIIIIGDHERQLTDRRMRESFEHFRTSLAGIEVITFDEFFRKLELLASLFGLVRSEKI